MIAASGTHPFRVGEGVLSPFYPPEVLVYWRTAYDRALHGERFKLETELVNIEGHPLVFENIFAPLRGPSDTIIGVLVVAHDITAHHQAKQQLAADLEAMVCLQKIGALFVREGNLEAVFDSIVDAAIAISGADFGNIQLLDPATGCLRIVTSRGFPDWWLDYWNAVAMRGGVCRAALERVERVIVEDVEQSPIFAGSPALEVQLRAGVRAVQSTPLVGRAGEPLGMLSTHYRTPGRPDPRALQMIDLLVRQATDIVQRAQNEQALRESEHRFMTMFRSSPLPAGISCAETGLYVDINDAFAAMYGFAREEIIGHSSAELDLWPDRKQRQLLLQRMEQDEVVRGFEATYRIKSGRTGDALVSAAFIKLNGRRHMFGMILDYTERKQAEELLRQSDQMQRTILSSMVEGVIFQGADGVILQCNESAEKILGLTHDQILGRTSMDPRWRAIREDGSDFVGSEHPAMLSLRTGKRYRDVLMGLNLPGDSLCWISINSEPLFKTGEAQAYAVITSFNDITSRRQTEAALRSSEERYRALVKASSNVVYFMSPDWSEMRHLAGQDFISNTQEPSRTWLQKYIHPDDQPYVLAVISEAIRSQSIFSLEHRVRRVDGSLGWTASRAIPIINAAGQIIEWFGMASDITDRKQAEEALRESELKFKTLVEHSPDVISRFDREHRLLYTSPAGELITGMPISAIIGKTHRELGMPDGLCSQTESELNRAFTGETVESRFEFVDAAGCTRHFHTILSPEFAADDSVLTVMSISRDVTEHRRLEQSLVEAQTQLAAHATDLEQAIARRTVELAATNQALQKEMESRERLEREILISVEQERQRLGRELHDGLSQQLTAIKFKLGILSPMPFRNWQEKENRNNV